MASWIVHLRIADKLLEFLPDLDAGQFAIGNVAPDSGVPDEKWETFDPPGEVTHYQTPESSGKIKVIEDLRFYRDHIKDQVTLAEDPQRFSFLLGYFYHLITDNLWSARIAQPTHERYQAEFDANPDFIWEVKKDWYGLDFTYVRSHPDSLFWTDFLAAKYDIEYLDYFPPGAIADKLMYIKQFYQRTDEEVESSLRLSGNIYLNEAELGLFVDGAYRDLLRVYYILFQQGEEHSELNSVMGLI